MGKSATEDILNYMREHREEGVPNNSAQAMFGTTRLSGIIYCLRKKGYNIKTNLEVCTTRYGKTKEYARYTLENE